MKNELKSSKSIIKLDEKKQIDKKIDIDAIKKILIPQNYSSLLIKPDNDSFSLIGNISYYTSYLIYGSSKPKPVNLESGIKNLSYKNNQNENSDENKVTTNENEDFNIDDFSMLDRIQTEESFRSNLEFHENNILTSLNSNNHQLKKSNNNILNSKKSKIEFPLKSLLKKLVKENFDEYLNKAKPYFPLFKKNHYEKNNSTIYEFKNNFYSSNKEFWKVNSIFLNDKNFKIPQNYFSTDINMLQNITFDLINSGELLEKELLKTIQYIPKLQSYISNNGNLNNTAEEGFERLKNIKAKLNMIKSHFIINNAKTIKLSLKRNHIKSMLTLANLLTKLKMCKDCLNVLSKNPSKYQLVFDLVNKSQELIEQTNSFTKKYKQTNGSLDCILNYENEFRKYTTSSSDKAFEDFINNFNTYTINLLDKNIKLATLEEFLNSNNEKSKSILTLLNDINILINDDINLTKYFNSLISNDVKESINFIQVPNTSIYKGILDLKNSNISKILEELLGIILRLDLNFFTKIKSLIRKTILKQFNESIDRIYSMICKNCNDLLSNLIILYYLKPLMKNSIEILYSLQDLIINVFDSTTLSNNNHKSKNLKEVLIEEFKNSEKEIFEEITNKFIFYIDKIHFKGINPVLFHKIKHTLNIVYSDIIVSMSKNKEFIPVINDICEKIENKKKINHKIFVNDYFENFHSYILGSVDSDDFKIVTSISSRFNSIVNLIEEFNFCDDDQNVDRYINTLISNLTKEAIDKNMFCIKGNQFKTIISSNLYVELIFNTTIILFNSSNNDEIIKVFSSYFKLLKNVAFYKRELVIEAKGNGKNFQKISQNHIIYLSADINFLIKLNEQFIIKFGNKIEAIKEIFNEFKINLDSIKYECKASILELYKDK